MDLLQLHRLLKTLIPITRSSQRQKFTDAGVYLPDDSAVYVTEITIDDISAGPGTKILPNVYLIGKVKIGRECIIWPNTILFNVTIGDRAEIGRPPIRDAILGDEVRIGAFTEIVRSTLEKGVAAQHWSYIGDTHAEEGVNFGAGSVTANYDGSQKKKTHVGKFAFIGILSALVAPLKIGREALVGARSLIRKDVPPNAVVVGEDRILRDKTWHRGKDKWFMRLRKEKN